MGKVVIPGFRKIETSGGGEGGTSNYEDLTNKPSINNVPLVGNLKTVDLKLTDATLTEEGVPAEAKTVGTKLEEHSTSLTALSEQLGNHTVKSDVPENAVFTDTVYDDTEVQKRISDNGYGEVAGGKNLIPYEDMNNLLSNMNDNADGTTHSYTDGVLSINRAANVNSGVYVYSSIFKRFDNKKVKISFDAKSSVNGMFLSIFLNNSSYSYTPILTSEYKRYSVEVVAGDTAHNFIIYGNAVAGEVNIKNVMFSEAVYNDTSYEPYFPSNKMLAEEKADKSETTVNLLNPTKETITQDGVTFTNNNDGTYTIKGTATQDVFDGLKILTLPKGRYKIVGAPSSYKNHLYITKLNDFSYVKYSDEEFEVTDISQEYSIVLRTYLGSSYTNILFKPMLTTNLDATYDDFVPYTGDEDSLNKDVAKLKNDLDKLSSLPIGSIIQIDENKDDIETTKQKYGWQYLGKSNIQYESGSATLLVTNVYRKND